MNRQSCNRRPGRPSGGRSRAVRRALLDATRDLCIERGLDAASSKAIADRAGVNPAMINYYFGSKEALCRAMMRDALAPILARLDALGSGGASLPDLARFIDGYMRTLAGNPWLPQLIVREVLPANGRFRELFFAEIGGRAARVLEVLLRNEFAADAGSVDPKLTAISIMSIAVFPFLAAPVLDAVLGVDVHDDAVVEQLVAHSQRVLAGGLFAGPIT